MPGAWTRERRRGWRHLTAAGVTRWRWFTLGGRHLPYLRRFRLLPAVADRLPRADATVYPVDLPIPVTDRSRSGSPIDPAKYGQ